MGAMRALVRHLVPRGSLLVGILASQKRVGQSKYQLPQPSFPRAGNGVAVVDDVIVVKSVSTYT